MQEYVRTILLIVQLLIFILGRILDDLSWYDMGTPDETATYQGITVAAMLVCIVLQVLRKCHTDGWWKILFFRSQLKFFFSWTLIATIIMFVVRIFECHPTVEEGSENPLALTLRECALNGVQVLLTNFNFSLICNTKAHPLELWVYQAILFAEIVTNGKLFLLFVIDLEGKEKDESILLVTLIIANQVLIMDLIFRAAYEEREREEQKEEQMLHHRRNTAFGTSHNTIPSTVNIPGTSQKFKSIDAQEFSH